MLHNFTNLLGATIHTSSLPQSNSTATKVGHLDDLLFDDKIWDVRYLVVKTFGFLKRGRILILPAAVQSIDSNSRQIFVNLSESQISLSPSAESNLPLFRQMEKKYFDYYDWPYYWDDMGFFGVDPRLAVSSDPEIYRTEGDPHLRSCRIINGYAMKTETTKVGKLHDIVIDDKSWKVVNFVVKAKSTWPGKMFTVNPPSVDSIDWLKRTANIRLSTQELSIEFKT